MRYFFLLCTFLTFAYASAQNTKEPSQAGKKMYERALSHIEDGEPQKGLMLLHRVLKDEPTYAEARIRRARLQSSFNNYGAAVRDYDYLYQMGSGKLGEDTYKTITMQYAQSLIQVQRNEEAKEVLKAYLKDHPNAPDALLHMGITHAFMPKPEWEKAMKYYEEGLEEAPEHVQLNYSMAFAYHNKEDFQAALKHYRAVIKNADPEEDAAFLSVAHYYEGFVLNAEKKHEQAIASLKKALEFNPKNDKALNELAVAQLAAEQPREAFATVNRLLSISEDYRYYKTRALVNMRLQFFDRAIEDFDRYLEKDKRDAEVFLNYAISMNKLGKPEQAMQKVSKAIDLNPGEAAYYYYRGDILLGLDIREEACVDFQQAANIGHDEADKALRRFCN